MFILWITIILGSIALIFVAVFLFVNQTCFGKKPSGSRKARIEASEHYRGGKFLNEIPTQQMTGKNNNSIKTLLRLLIRGYANRVPKEPVPAVKTDLKQLPKDEDLMVWFGHSGYLLQLSGKVILVDPTLVQASPVRFVNKPFKGSNIYLPEDMPDVDYMLVTHDHWDHLDYKTQMRLKDRVNEIIIPLGVGEHFEFWGFNTQHITELDWYEERRFDDGFVFHCTPTRHFSGRGLSPNQTLWASFVIESPNGRRVFIGGDGGYGPHFKNIGASYPDLDLAILENGQYNSNWANIHTMPEKLPLVMADLNAKRYITVHHGKYSLSTHPWDEPLLNEQEAATKSEKELITLTIGKVITL